MVISTRVNYAVIRKQKDSNYSTIKHHRLNRLKKKLSVQESRNSKVGLPARVNCLATESKRQEHRHKIRYTKEDAEKIIMVISTRANYAVINYPKTWRLFIRTRKRVFLCHPNFLLQQKRRPASVKQNRYLTQFCRIPDNFELQCNKTHANRTLLRYLRPKRMVSRCFSLRHRYPEEPASKLYMRAN